MANQNIEEKILELRELLDEISDKNELLDLAGSMRAVAGFHSRRARKMRKIPYKKRGEPSNRSLIIAMRMLNGETSADIARDINVCKARVVELANTGLKRAGLPKISESKKDKNNAIRILTSL